MEERGVVVSVVAGSSPVRLANLLRGTWRKYCEREGDDRPEPSDQAAAPMLANRRCRFESGRSPTFCF